MELECPEIEESLDEMGIPVVTEARELQAITEAPAKMARKETVGHLEAQECLEASEARETPE